MLHPFSQIIPLLWLKGKVLSEQFFCIVPGMLRMKADHEGEAFFLERGKHVKDKVPVERASRLSAYSGSKAALDRSFFGIPDKKQQASVVHVLIPL